MFRLVVSLPAVDHPACSAIHIFRLYQFQVGSLPHSDIDHPRRPLYAKVVHCPGSELVLNLFDETDLDVALNQGYKASVALAFLLEGLVEEEMVRRQDLELVLLNPVARQGRPRKRWVHGDIYYFVVVEYHHRWNRNGLDRSRHLDWGCALLWLEIGISLTAI